MAAVRRGCVNSLWSGTERVRIGERLKATLAGVLELELLRCKHLEMVDAVLGDRANATEPEPEPAEGSESQDDAGQSTATSRGQQVSPPALSAPNTNVQVCMPHPAAPSCLKRSIKCHPSEAVSVMTGLAQPFFPHQL